MMVPAKQMAAVTNILRGYWYAFLMLHRRYTVPMRAVAMRKGCKSAP